MDTKRTSTKDVYWYAVGIVSDKLIRCLREQTRREKMGEAGAPERVGSAPAETASVVDPQGKGAGGTET